MSKLETDLILEYYCKITKSDYLHYGYWELGDDITLENLHRAQEKYLDRLTSFIPENVQTILDVGCGIGGNALRLKKAGYQVESLSPDIAQQKMFKAKGEVPFHLSKFEEFETSKKYDLILMSESAQYIPIQQGLEKCRALLTEKGNLLISDYFIRQPEKHNVFAVCTHLESEYLKIAEQHGFHVTRSEDISLNVAPTLDLAKQKFDDYVKPTIELIDGLLQKHLSIPYKIGQFFAKSQLKNLSEQVQLIDSQLFLKYRKYMIYLFNLNN